MPKTIGGKSTARIRRGEPIDRTFIGTHSEQIQGREKWYEGTHMIKGVTFAVEHIIETNGLAQDLGCGMKVSGAAELPQNTISDYQFYNSVLNGVRNFAFVTGSGPAQLMRLFRLYYVGANQWQDNRIAMIADDKYDSSMDKASLKITGFIQSYEMYVVKNVRLVGDRLAFDIVEGTPPQMLSPDTTNNK